VAQPHELTDLLAAGEDEGGDAYALACLLDLNGLRVSEACNANITDLGGSRYQPTLLVLGKGDKPAEVVLNPRTQQAVDQAVEGRSTGPLLRNQWSRRMQPHNAAAILRRLASSAAVTVRVTPHALRRSYITIGLLQGVPPRDMQRAARHTKADTTVDYDQSERSFHKDPTFVLMAATARSRIACVLDRRTSGPHRVGDLRACRKAGTRSPAAGQSHAVHRTTLR